MLCSRSLSFSVCKVSYIIYIMKIRGLIFILLFLQGVSFAFGQNLVPNSIKGRDAIIVIASGSGVFATDGGCRLSLLDDAYVLTPLTYNVASSSGSYVWERLGNTTARIMAYESRSGAVVVYNITFTSATSGTFYVSSSYGSQSGSFIWEGVGSDNKLYAISTRGRVGTGADILIAGFIITGSVPKQVVVRAVGPSLALPPANIRDPLLDSVLEVYDSSGVVIAENDDWTVSSLAGSIIPANWVAGSRDSGLVLTLTPGAYTAQVKGKNGLTGVALVEVYEIP